VPSGLLSLASMIIGHKGVSVEVIDAESAGWGARQVVEHLSRIQPCAIGVSVCSPCVPAAMELIRELRVALPDSLILVGGKHITHCWKDAALKFSDADILVRGEGENVALTLANALNSNLSIKETKSIIAELPNVWVHEKSTDPILPHPFDLATASPWPFEVLTPSLSFYLDDRMLIEHSRGCPGHCSYCLASKDIKRVSFRSHTQVIDTLEQLTERGFGSYFFTDDDFAVSPLRLQRLCEGILERRISIKFDANVRPDSLLRCSSIATLLRRAGCRCLWLGIETGSPSMLKSYGKGFDIDICERAVALAFSSAEVVRTNWIIGGPLETKATVYESINFAKQLRRLGPHVPHISFMVPYLGTPIFGEALSEGLIEVSKGFQALQTTHDRPSIPSCYLSKDELMELFKEFHEKLFDKDFFAQAPTVVAAEAKLVLESAGIIQSQHSQQYTDI